MSNKLPLLAIIGRTNVGKSSIFNALIDHRRSIVEDFPGVTRDRNYSDVWTMGYGFRLVDTGGLVGEDDAEFAPMVQEHARAAMQEADALMVVFDGINGVHPLDSEIMAAIRTWNKPIIYVVNKCEKEMVKHSIGEFYGLGVDDLIPVSAAHRQGLRDLVSAIAEKLKLKRNQEREEFRKTEEDGPINIAIVGRPNVGKSTLVNKILGEDRLITSDQSGTTRDSIDIELTRDVQEYTLIDTAGLRKKSKIDPESLERFSNLRTLRSIARADVAVLVLDATIGRPSDQDKTLAELIHKRGLPLVIAVNKWDAVEKDHKSAKHFELELFEDLGFVKYAPVIFLSALTGKRCPFLFDKVKEVYASARKRIPTSELNRVLTRLFRQKPPPVYKGKPLKLFFSTQVESVPPKILLFLNYPRTLPGSYIRFLGNSLHKEFGFTGTDIKFDLRQRRTQSDNSEQGNSEQSETISHTEGDPAI
jgi:GTP-binding protein